MATRILVRFRGQYPDARAGYVEKRINSYLGISASVDRVDVYTIEEGLGGEELEKAESLFVDPVTQETLADGDYESLVEVGFLPGVKDTVGETSRKALSELAGRDVGPIYTSVQYRLRGAGKEETERIAAELLANSMIQHWRVFGRGENVEMPIPKVELGHVGEAKAVSLELDDAGLEKLSADCSLALGLADMKTIKEYYSREAVGAERAENGLPESPTDVELEIIAQTQSEHCKHRIFNGRIKYSGPEGKEEIDSLFKSYIKKSSEEIAKQRRWIVSMFWDNAGVASLNDEWNYVVKCETHNSPSALDPYGGAITGIVGVYRDPMGTGLGSKIVGSTYGFCTGSPFYDGELRPRMPPKRLLDGVVEGVKDGGNKSGIPTACGTVFFDDGWLGKPLVYVSAVGLMPKEVAGRKSHEKHIDSGDRVVMAGGRVGKDGIHGATESSLEGGAWITAGHVQIGDPFTQKKVQDFILEARDEGLYNAITDLGAGGISSAAGESACMSNGCTLDLDQVPLKYLGLEPWEILVSESQERMLLAVPPKNMERLRELAERHDVEMSDIGVFEGTGKFTALYGGKKVCFLDMGFLHAGFPQLQLEAEWAPKEWDEPTLPEEEHGRLIHEMVARENIASKEWVQRQYDHEVQGGSVIKPFIGAGNDGPGDAAVLRPVLDRKEGLAIAAGFNPKYSKIDAYHMAALSLDEALRKVISVGAALGHVALNDNFCWPNSVYDSEKNPDGRHKLAQLVRANKALYDYTTYFGTPCISGKDSMFIDGAVKDSSGKEHKVSGLGAVMFTAVAKVNDVEKCVSMDFKGGGDYVYIVGETNAELGASEYYEARGAVGNGVPELDKEKAKKNYESVEAAIAKGIVRSCHGCYRGGLGVALVMCCAAGDVGAEIGLDGLPGNAKTVVERLYSESGARFVVTVAPECASEFESLVADAKRIGTVGGDSLKITGVLDEKVKALRESWQKTFRGFW
ncbi:MAG: phosphoribosylformylglycinamidine synthase [Candidatus Diapherotrites archaeon]|nr:phosphoribosylformylglycinamidine synthase [Candidatus Diapherotrites archaeon]